MKSSLLVLVGLETHERRIARAAARRLFPEVRVIEQNGLDEFFQAPPDCAGGLVVVAGGSDEQIARALDAADEAGLPRWAVVVVGAARPLDAAGFVPRTHWNLRSATLVFRSTAALHAMRRENARLHGDLKSIATRFSHDIRSPLGAILTTCALLRELDEGPDAALVRALTESATEVLRIVERMAVVFQATRDPKAAEMLEMGDVVFRSLQRIQSESHEKHASIVVPGKWPVVRGVAGHLEVVWDCLLANSMKYGGDSASIRMGWKRTAVEYEFWIEDKGTIAPDQLEKLFVPLHALHAQRDRGGIELSIVMRLVELHGGRCGFERLPEAGSRFFFTLPVVDA